MDHVSQTTATPNVTHNENDGDDDTPGPDHWTREDIDSLIGAVFSIAENLQTIMEGVASATGQSAPKAGG